MFAGLIFLIAGVVFIPFIPIVGIPLVIIGVIVLALSLFGKLLSTAAKAGEKSAKEWGDEKTEILTPTLIMAGTLALLILAILAI